jgi:hypothetical protein
MARPERNFQITASTNSRLPSSLLGPTLPGRPGSKTLNPRELVVAQRVSPHRKPPKNEGSP